MRRREGSDDDGDEEDSVACLDFEPALILRAVRAIVVIFYDDDDEGDYVNDDDDDVVAAVVVATVAVVAVVAVAAVIAGVVVEGVRVCGLPLPSAHPGPLTMEWGRVGDCSFRCAHVCMHRGWVSSMNKMNEGKSDMR